MAVQLHVGNLLHDPLDHVVPDGAHLRGLGGDVRGGQLDGLAQAHDAGQVLGAGALAALLGAAVHQPLQAHAMAHVQRADALGRVELVARQAQKVDVLGLHVDLHVADGLHRVGVEQHAVPLRHRRQLRDGLDGADLVVGVHDGHQHGVRADSRLQLLRRHQAVAVHGQVGDLEALLLQLLAGVQDGVVLKVGGDDVPALFDIGVGRAPQRPVVGLCAAAGEVDFPGFRADGLRHLGPRRLHRLAGFPTEAVHRRGVAVDLTEVGLHRREDLLGHAGRRAVVHIYSHVVSSSCAVRRL